LERWLAAALDYVPRWLDYQMRLTEQPGCTLSVAVRGKVVLDAAFGQADLARGIPLTPRHRFRVASHSKSFTAAGILRLRERGKLRLDDAIGSHVGGLHRAVGAVTLGQLLSHGAGLLRDGADTGQWQDRRAFLDADEVRAELAAGTAIDPNTRFKYSNLGYGLLGFAIEAVTGERYVDWIAREVVAAAGLAETTPDVPLPTDALFARGHSARLPLGRRVVVPGENPTHALAAATGFVSTAADLARFYAALAPDARRSVLSVASRREMVRRLWRDSQATAERWYGLGTISGTLGDWDWFGHSGGFQGYITRTVCVPSQQLAVSVLTNAADGAAHAWLDGVLHLLAGYQRHGAPSRATAPWQGRWWTLWGAVDLLPVQHRVFVANPAQGNPFLDASELVPAPGREGADAAHIVVATGFGSHGEPVRLERDGRGRVRAVWLAGTRLVSEAAIARELDARYPGPATEAPAPTNGAARRPRRGSRASGRVPA
jgi:CubicO group peptidase (beta-lactamase class C family)